MHVERPNMHSHAQIRIKDFSHLSTSVFAVVTPVARDVKRKFQMYQSRSWKAMILAGGPGLAFVNVDQIPEHRQSDFKRKLLIPNQKTNPTIYHKPNTSPNSNP